MEVVTDFTFLGFKITADSDCSHKFKKLLLLGRKAMTNLDSSILKRTDIILQGSKITADGDCKHEIKRHLLLGRKAMTNLDSIFKSRDITLPRKVHLLKGMVFLLVMCGCKSWIIKKAECQRIDALELCVGEDS